MKTVKSWFLMSAVASVMATGSASATTTIAAGTNLFDLNGGAVVDLGTGVKPRAWFDERVETAPGTPNPAYFKAWTHNAKWGYFNAVSGSTYTITVVSSNADVHPGLSLYFRSNLFDNTGATTGLIYVKDHLFNPTQVSIGEKTPVDPSDNDGVSPYNMLLHSWGYDQDGVGNLSRARFHPIRDGVEGTLKITFTAAKTGTYMVAIGGINPKATLADPTAFYPMAVQVQEVITTPK